MRGALRAADGVDAAVHHGHPDPVPGDVERGPLAPLVGHRVVAAQGAGLRVVLKRQVPPSDLERKKKKRGIRTELMFESLQAVNANICLFRSGR